MSWAFVTALKKNPQQSYVQLLNSIRDELATRYTQKPQLSCSHPLGMFKAKSPQLHLVQLTTNIRYEPFIQTVIYIPTSVCLVNELEYQEPLICARRVRCVTATSLLRWDCGETENEE